MSLSLLLHQVLPSHSALGHLTPALSEGPLIPPEPLHDALQPPAAVFDARVTFSEATTLAWL